MASLSDPEALVMANETANNMANVETILKEQRELHRENGNGFQELKEEIKSINGKLDQAATRIMEVEDRIQEIEKVALKLSKARDEHKAKMTKLGERSRQENLRLYGIPEDTEENFSSIPAFTENLFRDKLDILTSFGIRIEKAHARWDLKPHLLLLHVQ